MQHTTLAVTATAVLIGALAAATAWFVVRPRTGWRVVLAVAAAGAVGVVATFSSLFVLVPSGLDQRGFLHLSYLLVTICVPMVGATLVAAGASGSRSGLAVGVGVVMLLPAPLGVYATHIEPYRLGTEHEILAVDPARTGDDPILIGILADLQTNHVGAHEQAAVDRIMAEEPDIILIPGDLFQGNREEIALEANAMRELLGQLDAPGGVYFVQGDSDHYIEMTTFLPGTGIVPLIDEIVDLEVGDRQVRIGGIRNLHDHGRTLEVIDELADEQEDDTIRIFVTHRPDEIYDLPVDSRVDLTVAGHTHGGQVSLPFFGPPVTRSDVPRAVASGGLHEVNGNSIVVSPGVGMVRAQNPQVRFLAPPAVTFVTID